MLIPFFDSHRKCNLPVVTVFSLTVFDVEQSSGFIDLQMQRLDIKEKSATSGGDESTILEGTGNLQKGI